MSDVALGRAGWIREAFRSGELVRDDVFDALYPSGVRRRSATFWTPVSVAVRAAALLVPEPGVRVLDVGAGCGKLCCVGALAAPQGTWCGIERERALVETAQRTALALGVERQTDFAVGDVLALGWQKFEALYFYNPFEALLFQRSIEGPIEGSPQWLAYCREIEMVEHLLSEMPTGTRVVTFHGFGGAVPDSYRRADGTPVAEDSLTLWIKQPARRRVAGHQP